jgi:hypothetical protein
MSISCKKASELTERKLQGELNLFGKISLWIHKKICGPCETYEDQSKIIQESLIKVMSSPKEVLDVTALKEKIKIKLG